MESVVGPQHYICKVTEAKAVLNFRRGQQFYPLLFCDVYIIRPRRLWLLWSEHNVVRDRSTKLRIIRVWKYAKVENIYYKTCHDREIDVREKPLSKPSMIVLPIDRKLLCRKFKRLLRKSRNSLFAFLVKQRQLAIWQLGTSFEYYSRYISSTMI